MQVNDPAERLDLAYLFANVSYWSPYWSAKNREVVELAEAARAISARSAMVHVFDLPMLVPLLGETKVRPEAVINFPDGLNGWRAIQAEAAQAAEDGAVSADLTVNLRHIKNSDKKKVVGDCLGVRQFFQEPIKLIAQVPYLWLYERDAIPRLLDFLPEAGVYCIKDWTTRNNFSVKINVSLNTRVRYTQYMADYITKQALPLWIKIAGGVDATNAKDFVSAGADLLGLSYGKAKSVREALLMK